MLKTKFRKTLLALLVTASAGMASPARAQQSEHPLLNSLGRELGIGYSRTGYHGAPDGRFGHVQPARNYPSAQLQYPYSPGYQPQRPIRLRPMPPAGRVQYSPAPITQPQKEPTKAPKIPDKKAPPKPVGPEPKWLKPYKVDAEQPEEIAPSRPLAPKSQQGELPPKKTGDAPFYIDPNLIEKTEAASPSDRNPLADELADENGLIDVETLRKQLLGDEDLPQVPDQKRLPSIDSLLEDDTPAKDDSLLDDSLDDSLLDGDSLLDEDDSLLLDPDDLSAKRPNYKRRFSQLPKQYPSTRYPGQKYPNRRYPGQPVRHR